MVTLEKLDPTNKTQVDRFIRIPFRLYANHPQWVPPIISDIKTMLDPNKHPFYEHSIAEHYIAVRDGQDVGRITVLENRPFNTYHGTREAEFYFFDSEDDQEVANALFNQVCEWAKGKNLNRIVGPKGFSLFDGYGIQVEGTDRRQMMTMMNYNYDYYPRLVETYGFTKEVDFVSCYLSRESFVLPEKVRLIAEKVQEKGTFTVHNFRNKKELIAIAQKVGEAYNKTFVNNWEYFPMSEREIKYVVDTIITLADPKLIKIVTHKDDVVGFLFAFPDVSAALQRAKGRLNPITIADLLIDMKRTKWVSLNGVGMLPEYHGRGGNALMYSEMEKTILGYNFLHAELTQVAETAVQMRKDLMNVGGKEIKNHRVYQMKI